MTDPSHVLDIPCQYTNARYNFNENLIINFQKFYINIVHGISTYVKHPTGIFVISIGQKSLNCIIVC